ncbi:MAG: metal ABC transporter permease [Actinomycetota bacterium]|nr:metal ABC transporter permease [Actinomycetota bacterium]
MNPQLGWDLVHDVDQLLAFPFMVNAYRAGTVVAILSGVAGWFMVLRRQSFAGHTLALVGFPGAAGAALVGVGAAYGFFAFAIAAALVIASVPGASSTRFSEESAVTGTVQALALGAGFLFVSLYASRDGGFLGNVNALLFGSFLGITDAQVTLLAVVAAVAVGILAAVGRPLLFASVDPDVAAARGVPVRGLAVLFLVVLGVAAAEVSQVTGSLLVFTLLVVPAAAAQALTARPVMSLLLTVLIGVGVTWLALFAGYFSSYPLGFLLTTLAFAVFLLAAGLARVRHR